MFAANGIGILYAEKAKWDVAKELFTQVRRDIKFIIVLCCFCIQTLKINSAI
jgi:hypothetical protein